MRIVRFRDPAGNVRRGEWSGTGTKITVREHYGGRIALGNETFSPADVDVLPPCDPSKIVCVGSNDEDHGDPSLFLKPPSAVAAHGDTITLPNDTQRFEYRAGFAVIIAEQCTNVRAKNAMDVVAGYTCLNDISNRDDCRERNWVRATAFDGAAPIGPVISRPENVPSDAAVRLRHNDTVEQDSSIDRLVPIGELIERLTGFMTLQQGDVIATGTPDGIGPLRDGDEIEIEIEGIATLAHSVRIP